MLADVKALNIHRQVDVKLNELAKLILMLRPPKNEKIKPMKQQRQQHKNLLWQFIQLNIPLPRDVKGLNIPLTP